jgi:hypothetical protein
MKGSAFSAKSLTVFACFLQNSSSIVPNPLARNRAGVISLVERTYGQDHKAANNPGLRYARGVGAILVEIQGN